ncbi:MAG: hypothetical protein IPG00_20675 [Saprospiraceae bacterium]|nr:hypothetical protein [Saprospiraceae bacterium]
MGLPGLYHRCHPLHQSGAVDLIKSVTPSPSLSPVLVVNLAYTSSNTKLHGLFGPVLSIDSEHQ